VSSRIIPTSAEAGIEVPGIAMFVSGFYTGEHG